MVLMMRRYTVVFLLGSLLVLAAAIFFMYFAFLCTFSVVVAVAEPGCHGAGALGRAWRLVKGTKRQAALYLAAISALTTAVSPVRTLATTCAGDSVALGLLLGFVYAVLLALVELFAVCAITAFYYERRENSDSQLGASGYAKLSTEEEANA